MLRKIAARFQKKPYELNPNNRLKMNFVRPIKTISKRILKELGIGILRYDTLEHLFQDREQRHRDHSAARDISLLQNLNDSNATLLLELLAKSKSQLRQDLFVLHYLKFRKNGYFVEFGAANGIELSNTYLMEKEFGWTGILAEPAKIWHKDLRNNRNCNIDTNCVWKDSCSKIDFLQTVTPELSTIEILADADSHKEARKDGMTYSVSTISLNDLLVKFNAPRHIDYLSLDTEGSEYEILSSFDFRKHTFEVITCEHNYTSKRDKLYSLLTGKGYKRVFENFSFFDDWYVKSV